jgi:hypothetical protein
MAKTCIYKMILSGLLLNRLVFRGWIMLATVLCVADAYTHICRVLSIHYLDSTEKKEESLKKAQHGKFEKVAIWRLLWNLQCDTLVPIHLKWHMVTN